jgi:ATP-dependent Lhr-like helicase
VLRTVRQRSLARLRHEVEPVEAPALARFLTRWHGLARQRHGLDGLLDTIEQLQGAPVAASVLEREVLAARVRDYAPTMLDTLLAAGEITWVGAAPLGERDGRVALYLTDHVAALRPPKDPQADDEPEGRAAAIVGYLREHGASFFSQIHEAVGGGFPQATVDAIWNLVWRGLVTNDTLHALRAFVSPPQRSRRAPRMRNGFRSRRLVPLSAEGRWTLVPPPASSQTAWATAVAQQLLARHGVVTRDVAAVEQLPGGFSSVYPVLRRLEETGRIRRGYFVAGLGGAQFALPAAVDFLRDARDERDEVVAAPVAATDPGNPYGVLIPWPKVIGEDSRGATRTVGSTAVLVDGRMAAWINRGARQLIVCLPEDEPERSRIGRALARELVEMAERSSERRRGWLIEEINGQPAIEHSSREFLLEAGFASTARGLQLRVARVARVPRGAERTTPPLDDSTTSVRARDA